MSGSATLGPPEARQERVSARAERTGAKKTARRKLYELHSWVGFHLALLMGVILFTGTIATISNEIDWLFQHDMRVAPGSERVSWGEMEEAVREYAPDRNIVSIYDMGGDYLAFRARVEDELGNQSFVHVDQWTGEVTGETHPFTVQRFFRDLHRYLFMPGVIALPIVCSMAFVLLISLYTGLKTSRNWRTLMVRVRTGKGLRIFWGDAHKAAGLWSTWFLVVIAVTAMWYLLEWGYGVAGTRMTPDRPSITAERVEDFGPIIADRPLAEIVRSARAAYPDLHVTSVQYPTSATGPFTVLGTNINPVLRERANMVFVDPADAEVIEVMTESDMDTVGYLNEMADPLHFGNFGGLASKAIWFVFGVFLTGLSLTGVWLTWKRLRSKRITRAQLATSPVLVAAVVLGCLYVDRYVAENRSPQGERLLAERTWGAGAFARLALNAEPGPEEPAFRLLLRSQGRPNLERVELCGERVCAQGKVPRLAGRMSIPFSGPRELVSGGTITVKMHFAGGTQRSLTWRAGEEEPLAQRV